MSERLLTRKETAQRFSMSLRTFERRKAKLIALGLQYTRLGNVNKYSETSVDRVIRRLIENGGMR